MKNADKPIYPTTSQKINETEFFEYNLPNKEKQYSGLTKREYFAGLAMQGLLNNTAFTVKFIASKSVQIAEELLKQLENSNTKNQDDRN